MLGWLPKRGWCLLTLELPQRDEPWLCLHRTADMSAIPRPALLPLVPLLLLHVPQAARAQVNPGK